MTETMQLQGRTPQKMQVRLEHMDKLLSLAGEVIITSANLQDMERRVQSAVTRRQTLGPESLDIIKTSNESTRRISQDLHDLVMAIRLVEIGDTMRLFKRPVRDLARTLEKEISLVFEGADTMIDKALAERLVDPLLHLLRNAVDHGAISPIERAAAGLPQTVTVTLRAVNLEHAVEISVTDDGRGIDDEAIRRLAEQSGIIEIDQPCALIDILCTPGFSTRTAATQTSGRGVGLDLVREMVSEFGGELSIESAVGQGTTVTMTIPKLRAVNIIDALTLSAGHLLFALPIHRIEASLGIPRNSIRNAFQKERYIVYQGETVPICDLLEVLGEGTCEAGRDLLPVVILQSRDAKLALIVSEFLGPQKLVNIPFEENMSHAQAIAGTTVFTGGKLGLTVDVDALIDATLNLRGPVEKTLDLAFASAPPANISNTVSLASSRSESPQEALTTELGSSDVNDLLSEMSTSLSALQDILLGLETSDNTHRDIKDAFRRLHGIKANFSMLEMDPIVNFAHRLETVMDYIRSERLTMTPDLMDLLLDSVSFLTRVTDALPQKVLGPEEELSERLLQRCEVPQENTLCDRDIIGRAFDMTPEIELQMVTARKRGHHVFETYFTFHPGRQADYLVAYLWLCRLGAMGTVLSTLPSIAEIEQGQCGNAIKVLWSADKTEKALKERLEEHAPLYDVSSYQTVEITRLPGTTD
ncbi:MAG: chemotaxis protein CheW [Deltaproteobacteria bacterium]|nr:chemotaxis protein CheW [Deltaproteobacteria bacterium]